MIISEDDLDIEHQAPEPEPEPIPVPELTKSEPIGHNPFRRGLIDVFTVLGVEIPEEFKKHGVYIFPASGNLDMAWRSISIFLKNQKSLGKSHDFSTEVVSVDNKCEAKNWHSTGKEIRNNVIHNFTEAILSNLEGDARMDSRIENLRRYCLLIEKESYYTSTSKTLYHCALAEHVYFASTDKTAVPEFLCYINNQMQAEAAAVVDIAVGHVGGLDDGRDGANEIEGQLVAEAGHDLGVDMECNPEHFIYIENIARSLALARDVQEDDIELVRRVNSTSSPSVETRAANFERILERVRRFNAASNTPGDGSGAIHYAILAEIARDVIDNPVDEAREDGRAIDVSNLRTVRNRVNVNRIEPIPIELGVPLQDEIAIPTLEQTRRANRRDSRRQRRIPRRANDTDGQGSGLPEYYGPRRGLTNHRMSTFFRQLHNANPDITRTSARVRLAAEDERRMRERLSLNQRNHVIEAIGDAMDIVEPRNHILRLRGAVLDGVHRAAQAAEARRIRANRVEMDRIANLPREPTGDVGTGENGRPGEREDVAAGEPCEREDANEDVAAGEPCEREVDGDPAV